jgi:fibro-slime domain-containing protein
VNNITRDRNFHFTLELETAFVYRTGTAQLFAFRGDDDVWAFIDGRLVIDIGGMHSSTSQVVHLDRLGLVDGTSYPLKLFFAERRRNGSNFRVASNFPLASPLLPAPASDPMEWLRTITTARTSIRTQLFSGAFTSVDLDSGAGFNQPIAVEAEL